MEKVGLQERLMSGCAQNVKALISINQREGRKMKARGVKELKAYLNGDRLTQRQAIIAKCADCTNYYADGKNDCLIPDCPLYPYQPYQLTVSKPKKSVKTPTMGQKEALARGRIRAKENREAKVLINQ